MDKKIEPQEIAETELDDELADEALDRPAMVAGSACTNHWSVMGPLRLGAAPVPAQKP